jgi:hypothetical protein
VCLNIFLMGGCSIWESYLHPDHGTTRADRICHPYGDCVPGKWVSRDGAETDPTSAHSVCVALVIAEPGNDWKKDSVTEGLEIGECMEQKGFILRQ